MTHKANTIRSEQKQIAPKKPKRAVGRQMHSLLDGSFMAKGSIASWVPFIVFLALLGLVYIKSNYTAEQYERNLNRLNKELIELHYDHIQMKSVVNIRTQPSTLENELQSYGIKRLERPPVKIFINP